MKFAIRQGRASAGSPSRPSVQRHRYVFSAACMTLIGVAAGQFLTSPANSDSRQNQNPVVGVDVNLTVAPQAIPALEQRVRQNKNDRAALRELSLAYTAQAETGNPSLYELADRAVTRAERIDPEDDRTKIVRATLDLSLHQFDRAYRVAGDVHKRNPDLLAANAVLVDAMIELGKYDEAAPLLQKFVDTRASLPSYARVSYLRELHGDIDGAIVAMQLAINAGQRGSRELATVTSLLGDLEFGRGNYDAARLAYTEAFRLAPDMPLPQLGLARVEAAQGRVAEAIAQLRSLTERYPLPAAVVLLGDLHLKQGDRRAAQQSWELVDAIVATQQASGQVVDLEMALFHLDHDRIATGVELAERAYAARPENVFAADALAWARHRQGRYDEAATLSAKALRLGSKDATVLRHADAIAVSAIVH